jgi:hypothetical protein
MVNFVGIGLRVLAAGTGCSGGYFGWGMMLVTKYRSTAMTK